MTPMVVQCSSCLTEFELDPGKVPAAGVRARCSVCSAVIVVPAPRKTVQAASAAAAPPARGSASVPASAEPAAPRPGSLTERTPPASSAGTQTATPAATHGPTHAATPAATPAPSASAGNPASPTVGEPSTIEQLVAATGEDQAPRSWSSPAATPADAPQKAQPAAAATTAHPGPWAAPAPSAAAVPSAEPDGQRRSINPFLTRDPALRAKRLARALVSDIVAYHPARHAEGLRDGTLKTLFRDEIKKSYEEYVDQVGRDFAGSTTHFQDALNDVLASGKKLF